jgi:hypothetical protein
MQSILEKIPIKIMIRSIDILKNNNKSRELSNQR